MTDIDELRRLAQAATPGPWKVGQYLGSPRQFVIHMDVGDKGRGSDVAFTSANFGNDETIANARLIAAANPAAVSELIDRLEAAEKERYALRSKIEAMEKQEPVAWRTFDGEGGYDFRSYEWNENYKLEWDARNPNHAGWIEPLYALPGAQPAPSVPECPYPCGWRNLLKHAIEDGAYLARSINEDEPVTENARAVTMRMVLRLRDVLMAISNAATEAKP